MTFWHLLLLSLLVATCRKANAASSPPPSEQLVISALIDHPNFALLELTACSFIANFNAYSFFQLDISGASYTYHGDSLSNIAAGSRIYVAVAAGYGGVGLDAASFQNFFGLATAPPNLFFTTDFQFYGHWKLQLLHGATVADTYDGGVLPFDYGWAVRKSDTTASASFNADNWQVDGTGTYVLSPATNSDASNPITLGSYACPVPTIAPVVPETPAPSQIPTLRPSLAGRVPNGRIRDVADHNRPVVQTPTPTNPPTNNSAQSTTYETTKPTRQPRLKKPTHKPRKLRDADVV